MSCTHHMFHILEEVGKCNHLRPIYLEKAHFKWSLYSLIWDFLLSQTNIWTTTTWSNVWVVLLKPSWYEFLIGFFDMNTRFKIFTSYNILQNPCNFIHVLIFVTVLKCRKSPKLTNIVTMASHPTKCHDKSWVWNYLWRGCENLCFALSYIAPSRSLISSSTLPPCDTPKAE